jgi:hypothetical protein
MTTGEPRRPAKAEAAETSLGFDHRITGRVELRRVGWWSFPVYEMRRDGVPVARLGRGGWLTVHLGRGQRIELTTGHDWRVTSSGGAGTFHPVILDSVGRRVATGGASGSAYGINGRDGSFLLYPGDTRGVGRANRWIIRQDDTVKADLTRYPAAIDAHSPIHLGIVIMAFVLVRHGLPDESMPRIPALRWNQR